MKPPPVKMHVAVSSHATGKNCRASSLPIAQRAEAGTTSRPLLLALSRTVV